MKVKKLSDKQLSELKSKHVDRYYFHSNKAEAHKKFVNEINDEQVDRLLQIIRKPKQRGKKDGM